MVTIKVNDTGDPIDGENPNDPSAARARMRFGPNSVMFDFELPDYCETVNRVIVKSFASKVVDAADKGADSAVEATVVTGVPGN